MSKNFFIFVMSKAKDNRSESSAAPAFFLKRDRLSDIIYLADKLICCIFVPCLILA